MPTRVKSRFRNIIGTSGVLLALVIALPLLVRAQVVEDQPKPAPKNPYGSGIGMNIALTNSGFGFGAYWMRSISTTGSLVVDFMITTLKDDREQRFFGLFGESVIPNKENYVHVIPVQFGFQKRMFKESIEDNFRPFIHLAAGPTFGWVSPYYVDTNFNDRRDDGGPGDEAGRFEPPLDIFSAFPKGHFELGVGATIAIGAHFGVSKKSTNGILFGFTFDIFPQGIHVLEPGVKDPTTWFGTPTLTLTFGKLG